MILPTKIHIRLSLLMGLVIMIFISGIIIFQISQRGDIEVILNDRREEKVALVKELIELYGESIKNFNYDYSYWDEMVSFIVNADTGWAAENIDVGLETFKTSASWAFDSLGNRVYSVADSQYELALDDSTFDGIVISSFDGSWFGHSFYLSPVGLMEYFIAPIQPGSDNDRITPPRGIFVTGKIWSDEYLAKIGQKAGVEVRLRRDKPPSSRINPGLIEFNFPLLNHVGDTLVFLICNSSTPLYTEFVRSSEAYILYLSAFGGTILLIISLSLIFWVGRPVRSISMALRNNNSQDVEKLSNDKSEFGKVAKLIKAFFDQKLELERQIEQHRRTESALAASESRYRIVSEQVGQIVYDWDVESGRIIWTGAVEAITGYTVEEFNRFSITDWEAMIHLDDQKAAVENLRKAESEAGKYNAEYRFRHKDGSYTCIEDNGIFICDSSDRVRQMLGAMKDITERKNAESSRAELQDKLQRAERMESLGMLAGGVAHDLNNMLSPVVGYAELLLLDLSENPKSIERVKKVIQSAQDAADVIQDLLTLARRGRYEITPLRLNDVIGSFMDSPGFVNLKNKYNNVVFQTSLAPGDYALNGSRPHLEKVLMNIIINACEAMPNGGSLTIETEVKYLETIFSGQCKIAESDYIIMRIRDTGVGIAATDIPKIFEPYFSKKQMGHSGSGLGLSVVYGVVKDHGGYYDVLSEIGKGTEFIFYFPLCELPIKEHDKTARLIGGLGKILVIDDSKDQRDLAKEIISGLGYTVYTASNGREALSFLASTCVDLLILDMIMEPDFDGLDTYREALKICLGQKAIVVSGYSANESVQEVLRMGAGQYLKKPYTIQQIAKAILREIGGISPPSNSGIARETQKPAKDLQPCT